MCIGHTEINEDIVLISALRSPLSNGDDKDHYKARRGIPGWCSGLAPAFGPGRNPGDPGSNPTLGSRYMEPTSPSAYVSASLSLSVTIINK